MRHAIAIAALFALSGCGTPAINCPMLVAYTTIEQSTLAAEFPKDGPETQAQLEDYIKLRQGCRK